MVKCVIVGCKCGYSFKQSGTKKFKFIIVPKDEKIIKLWQIAIFRDDIKLKAGDAICHEHFDPDDLIWERLTFAADGLTVLGRSAYQRPKLRKGAIPMLLLGRPEKHEKKPRNRGRKRRADRENLEISTDSTKRGKKEDTEPEAGTLEAMDNTKEEPNIEDNLNDIDPTTRGREKLTKVNNDIEPPNPYKDLFQKIFDDQKSLSLPVSWGRTNFSWGKNKDPAIFFHHLTGIKNKSGHVETICQKEITIDQYMTLMIKVNGRHVEHKAFGIERDQLDSIENLQNVVDIIDRRNICQGCSDITLTSDKENLLRSFSWLDGAGAVRHNNCLQLLPTDSDTKISICKCCKTVKNLLRKKIIRRQHNKSTNYLNVKDLSPRKREKLLILKKSLDSKNRAKKRAAIRVQMLKGVVRQFQDKMINVTEEALNDSIDKNGKINKNEKIAIQEILKALKAKHPKGRRYADEWIILCILLHMRSPATYRMIHDLKILPIPCERTIRRYLGQMDCPCGFDPKFFEIMKNHFAKKSGKQFHGVLLLDEMSTRKNLLLDKKTMTYKGVADFGDNLPKDIDSQMADHALVLVFQPLYDDYSQPIAVFASNGPTHGDELAKIVVQAIVLLENAGATIHGVISDGGAPNRKMWSLMGCSGKMEDFKNSFEHPLDEKRKVFFFWDTPHLIKCIRNRLANSGKLKVHPEEDEINWEYFKILYEIDKQQTIRMCPHLTDAHIEIMKKSMLKMRVSLAVQIFSRSVYLALMHYRDFEARLRHCGSTAEFCLKLNNMFDALNRTSIETGLKLDSADMKILEDSLTWLNEWESRVNDGSLTPEDFLTPQTRHLLQDLKMNVVITGRINQDPLERFFGTARYAGGTNDHPGMPTFLQIYKILAFFSILSPPLNGNCSVPQGDPSQPLISMSKLKEIFKTDTKKSSIIDEIKEKLNIVITQEDSDFSDFINAVDHDYDLPPVIDCLIYFVTGQVSKNLQKFTKCETCRTGFFYSTENSMQIQHYPIARIITLNQENVKEQQQGLIRHPNKRLFNFLQIVEHSFKKHKNRSNVFELVVNEVTEQQLNFPCSKHAKDVYAYVISFYLENRLRQFERIKMAETRKDNVEKKKAAKLVET